MDQLSAIYYKFAKERDDVEKLVNNSNFTEEQKKRWKGMLIVLTGNQLQELKESLIRDRNNFKIEHPVDFLKVDQQDDNMMAGNV